MSFKEDWSWPEGRPISYDRAKELLKGDYGRYCYEILGQMCSQLYWHFPDERGGRAIRANGALSYVRSEGQIFGATAAHVISEYLKDKNTPACVLQLGNAAFSADVIDMDERLDLATLRLSDDQITWLRDHDNYIPMPGFPPLPKNTNLGGISGGPLIAWFEQPGTYLRAHPRSSDSR